MPLVANGDEQVELKKTQDHYPLVANEGEGWVSL